MKFISCVPSGTVVWCFPYSVFQFALRRGCAVFIRKRFFTLFCGIKIITYKIGIEKEHYLLQNVSCLKLRTEVE